MLKEYSLTEGSIGDLLEMKNGIFDFKDGISMKITRSDPKTFGEKLRKARMDAFLLIKELTALEKKTDFPQYQHL